MCLILPASSSPDLKAFPLHLRHYRSCGSAPSLPNLPRAGRVGRFAPNGETVCFVPLRSTNPTDSPDSRFSVGALVVLSVCLCMWRKDRYLPYECQCVRHLPWTNVLACSMFVPAFRHCFAAPKVCPDHPSGERDSRFSVCVSLTFISRRKGCCVGYKFSKEMHLAAIASRCFYCTGNIA